MYIVLSQCLALIGAGFLQVGVGTELICTTFIIGELSGGDSKENERLTMTDEEASWFGRYSLTGLHKFVISRAGPPPIHRDHRDE